VNIVFDCHRDSALAAAWQCLSRPFSGALGAIGNETMTRSAPCRVAYSGVLGHNEKRGKRKPMEEEIQMPDRQAGGGFSRVLPDPKVCRTKPIRSFSALAACLVKRPCECLYATSFGKGYYCVHPRWRVFGSDAKEDSG